MRIKACVDGKLARADQIGVHVDKVINQYKAAEYFEMAFAR